LWRRARLAPPPGLWEDRRVADEILERLGSEPGVAVVISTGTEHWRAGEITLRLHGSGAVEVEQRRSGEHSEYTATFGADELVALGVELARNGFTTLTRDRTTSQPDEHSVTLELRRGDEVLHREQLPEGDDRLEGILAAYRRVVERVTGGALPYGAAAAPR
jgi:hypothetical protein